MSQHSILIVVPHYSLLSPQGHRVRFDGLLSLLTGHQLHIALPRKTPLEDRLGLENCTLHEFDELSCFGYALPYFADFQPSFRKRITEIARQSQATIGIFDFPWGLSACAPAIDIPLLYFAHGVESEFVEVTITHLGWLGSILAPILRRYISYIEAKSCENSSAIICMSTRDAAVFKSEFQLEESKLWALPQPMIPRKPTVSPANMRKKHGIASSTFLLCFHGSWAHQPNRQALTYLQEVVAPALLAAHLDAKLLLAGPGVPRFHTDNVLSLGFVEDIDSLIACCDLAVVPVIRGSGVRMKLYDYYALGIPVLATRKAAEGLAVEGEAHTVIVDDDLEAFLARLLWLIKNPTQLHAAHNAAQEFLKRCAPEVLHQQLEQILSTSLTAK